jgi:hypothetical protein
MVSELHSAFDRGRVPAHEIRQVMETSLMLLLAKARAGRHQFVAFQLGFHTEKENLHVAARSYTDMISEHYMSYDRFSRPYVNYELPKVVSPSEQFTKYMYYQMAGFWPEQDVEISWELTLIPDVIRCRRSGCTATKELAIFLPLRRWHIAGKWEAVSKDMRQHRTW